MKDVFKNSDGKHLEVGEITEDAFTIIGVIAIGYVLACNIYKRNLIKTFIVALGDFSTFGKPKSINTLNKRIDFLVKIHILFNILGGLTYATHGLIEVKICEASRQKNHSWNVCGLLVNTWWFVNVDFFPVKHILLLCEVTAGVFIVICVSCSENIVWASTELLICRIEDFKGKLEYIKKAETLEGKKKIMAICVRYHLNIIK